jgi:hypothetical protein
MRSVVMTWEAVKPVGGTKRSSALVVEPAGVATRTRPEVAPGGTGKAMLEVEAVAILPRTCPIATVFSAAVEPKLLPLTVIDVPESATLAERLLIEGSWGAATTVNASLESDPPGDVTEIAPVDAPPGTVTWSCVSVAAVTVALAEPAKTTVFEAGVELNPVP